MADGILKEAAMLEEIEEATNDCVLTWAQSGEWAQKVVLNSIKEAKEFDVIWQNTQIHECETKCSDKCKYCRTGYAPLQFPSYWKKCRECGKANISRWSVDPHEDSKRTDRPRRWLMWCTRKARLA